MEGVNRPREGKPPSQTVQCIECRYTRRVRLINPHRCVGRNGFEAHHRNHKIGANRRYGHAYLLRGRPTTLGIRQHIANLVESRLKRRAGNGAIRCLKLEVQHLPLNGNLSRSAAVRFYSCILLVTHGSAEIETARRTIIDGGKVIVFLVPKEITTWNNLGCELRGYAH